MRIWQQSQMMQTITTEGGPDFDVDDEEEGSDVDGDYHVVHFDRH